MPLFNALHAGCTGVEADVWLIDDELYVGHNTASLTRNRTFTSLYVNPLVELLERQNPETEFYHGRSHGVFDTDPGVPVTLLVDLKTDGEATWLKVLEQLEPLRVRGWLTSTNGTHRHESVVTVVGTGNTPFDVLTRNATRDAFFDAPLERMWEADSSAPEGWPAWDDGAPGEVLVEGETSAEEGREFSSPSSSSRPGAAIGDGDGDRSNPASSTGQEMATGGDNVGQGLTGILPSTVFSAQNSHYASVSFAASIGHLWRGRLSHRQMALLRGYIRGAHSRGLKARFWDTPAWPIGLRDHVWDVLVREGADTLNVDDLRGVRRGVW